MKSFLLDRQPHATASSAVWTLIESRKAKGYLSSHGANGAITELLRVFRVAPVDRLVIEDALTLAFADFEDAVTAAAARHAGCDAVVTRDPKGFKDSPVRPLPPEAALA